MPYLKFVSNCLGGSDDSLFQKVINNHNHVLHKLLPEQSTHDYYLTPRSHDRSLRVKTDKPVGDTVRSLV